MARYTLKDDKEIESSFRREKRVFLYNAPRDLDRLKKLTDWQIYCLAAALSLTDAVIRVRRTTFDKLDRVEREALLHAGLLEYDQQRSGRKRIDDSTYWPDLIQKCLRKEQQHDVSS